MSDDGIGISPEVHDRIFLPLVQGNGGLTRQFEGLGLGLAYVQRLVDLLGGTISSHAINVSLYAKLDYDPIKSFEPVAMLGSGPLVLAVNASSPYKTLNDVLAASKSKAGGLSSATRPESNRLTRRIPR